MHKDDVQHRLTGGVEHLRDRTADLISADGDSVFKALSELRSRVGAAEDQVTGRIDDSTDHLSSQLTELARQGRRTTGPRKLFWLALGAAAGLAAAYLGDPERGRARRAQLSDQANSRGREVLTQARTRAKVATDRVRGQAIEQAKDMLPDTAETDPALLEQRVRSEVFGRRDDVTDVVLRVDAPGTVALKGTVPSHDSERELLSEVAEVDGVIDVTSELAVRS